MKPMSRVEQKAARRAARHATFARDGFVTASLASAPPLAAAAEHPALGTVKVSRCGNGAGQVSDWHGRNSRGYRVDTSDLECGVTDGEADTRVGRLAGMMPATKYLERASTVLVFRDRPNTIDRAADREQEIMNDRALATRLAAEAADLYTDAERAAARARLRR